MTKPKKTKKTIIGFRNRSLGFKKNKLNKINKNTAVSLMFHVFVQLIQYDLKKYLRKTVKHIIMFVLSNIII